MTHLVQTLISPLFWLLIFALGLWLYLLVRPDYYLRGAWWHLMVRMYFVIWLIFYLLSTPVGTVFLHKTLLIPATPPDTFRPDFIAVIPMGFVNTGDPQTDYLTLPSNANLLAAGRQLEKFPGARVVLFGGLPPAGQSRSHIADLMLRFAGSHDIPADRVLIVSSGRRLRDFPIEMALLPEVEPGSHIGVVCSDFQFRRFKRLFNRAFDTVVLYPAPSPVQKARGIEWVLPREQHLIVSAGYLREWLAVLLTQIY